MNTTSRQTMSTEALEALFAARGVGKRHLYPWWYRGYRAIGIAAPLPVLYRWRDHLLYTGSPVALVLLAGAMYLWFAGAPAPRDLVPLTSMILIVPTANWLRYRRIRRRLGLDAN